MRESEIEQCEKTKIDSFYSSVSRSMPVEEDSNGSIPDEIMSREDHTDEFDRKRNLINNAPRECSLQIEREKDLRLPKPKE